MNTLNALGFLVCGCGMILLPSVAPGFFPVVSGGTSDQWVEFMGCVNGLTGGGYLVVRRLTATVRRTLAWPPEPVEMRPAAELLRPALVETAGEIPIIAAAQRQAA